MIPLRILWRSLSPATIKAGAIALALVLALWGGWWVRGLYEARNDAQALQEALRARQAAEALAQQLDRALLAQKGLNDGLQAELDAALAADPGASTPAVTGGQLRAVIGTWDRAAPRGSD